MDGLCLLKVYISSDCQLKSGIKNVLLKKWTYIHAGSHYVVLAGLELAM